jgi:hypothetical protein
LKVDYRPETAPFNKNPTKAGGVFCFGGVGCSAPSPLPGARSHHQLEQNTPPVVWYLSSKKEKIVK